MASAFGRVVLPASSPCRRPLLGRVCAAPARGRVSASGRPANASSSCA